MVNALIQTNILPLAQWVVWSTPLEITDIIDNFIQCWKTTYLCELFPACHLQNVKYCGSKLVVLHIYKVPKSCEILKFVSKKIPSNDKMPPSLLTAHTIKYHAAYSKLWYHPRIAYWSVHMLGGKYFFLKLWNRILTSTFLGRHR